MSGIPTESRLFATRTLREVRRLEALYAGRLSPGAVTWADAVQDLHRRMMEMPSPVKKAALLQRAIQTLEGCPLEEMSHFIIEAGGRKRSACISLGAFRASRHPIRGVEEEGLSIAENVLSSNRAGEVWLMVGTDLAYVSWHAIARLHERQPKLTPTDATALFAFAGILGLITRKSPAHAKGELCLQIGNALAVGSLKHATAVTNQHTLLDGTFYDVRTVLSAEEVRDPGQTEQGCIASNIVSQWLKERDLSKLEDLASLIPFRPRREDDHTLRSVRQGLDTPSTLALLLARKSPALMLEALGVAHESGERKTGRSRTACPSSSPYAQDGRDRDPRSQ